MHRDARMISQTRAHSSIELYIGASGLLSEFAVRPSIFAYTSQFQNKRVKCKRTAPEAAHAGTKLWDLKLRFNFYKV